MRREARRRRQKLTGEEEGEVSEEGRSNEEGSVAGSEEGAVSVEGSTEGGRRRRRGRRTEAKTEEAEEAKDEKENKSDQKEEVSAPQNAKEEIKEAEDDAASKASEAPSSKGRRRARRNKKTEDDESEKAETESITSKAKSEEGSEVPKKDDEKRSSRAESPGLVEDSPRPSETSLADEEVLQITIHGTDELKANMFLIHPVIKMSVMNTEDGQYVTKPRPKRSVVLQHENATEVDEIKRAASSASKANKKGKGGDRTGSDDEEEEVYLKSKGYDKVLPVLTQPFDLSVHLREGKPLACAWEEAIGLNEKKRFFLNEKYVFIFELMDFIHTTDNAEADLKTLMKHKGWKHIAWAFLRPNSATLTHMKEATKLRLQMYKYRSFWFWEKQPKGDDVCLAYHQWKAGSWKPYKSTLFVTVEGISKPGKTLVANRAQMPWEKEEGEKFDFKRNVDDHRRQSIIGEHGLDKTRLGKKWIGATGKWCKPPNTMMHKLESDHRGCFALSFSTFGTFLACAVGGRQVYRIKIFNVANGSLARTLPGHHEIVYDMQWAMESEDVALGESTDANMSLDQSAMENEIADSGPLLLTASADTTAKVWRVETAALVAACHHPAYVYAARFCAGPDGVRGETPQERAVSACAFVVTGCFDTNIRLWDVRPDQVADSGVGQITKLIEGHLSHINSIVIDHGATKVYSADGVGQIRVWSLARHSFDVIKEVNEPEVKGDALNCLRLDRTGKKLLVLARDNCVRMLDTERWSIIQRYSGLKCTQHQIRCDLSPDGKFVMAGSEDGHVFVWNADTGEQGTTAEKEKLPNLGSMCTDVCWNPAERIVAACSFTRKAPVVVYKYEREADVGTEEMADEEVRDVLQGKFDGLAEAFKRLDKSGDGKLQIEEFRDGILAMELDLSEMQIFRMFKTVAGPTNEIDLEDFMKRFAPAGTMDKIKNTQTNKRRSGKPEKPRRSGAAALSLLEELDNPNPRRTTSGTTPTRTRS